MQGCCGKGQEAGKGPGISDHFGGGVCVGHVIGPFWLLEVCCLSAVPVGVDPMFFFFIGAAVPLEITMEDPSLIPGPKMEDGALPAPPEGMSYLGRQKGVMTWILSWKMKGWNSPMKRKENGLNQTSMSMIMFHVNLQGCTCNRMTVSRQILLEMCFLEKMSAYITINR